VIIIDPLWSELYTKAKPNRFAPQDSRSKMTVIVLDEDIAQVFPTSEAVNTALRDLSINELQLMDCWCEEDSCKAHLSIALSP
jgi:hypothetical protein